MTQSCPDSSPWRLWPSCACGVEANTSKGKPCTCCEAEMKKKRKRPKEKEPHLTQMRLALADISDPAELCALPGMRGPRQLATFAVAKYFRPGCPFLRVAPSVHSSDCGFEKQGPLQGYRASRIKCYHFSEPCAKP